MARDAVASLKQVIQPMTRQFEARCSEEGLDVLIYCGLRTPAEQAKLWRVGRSRASIDLKVEELRGKVADLVTGRTEPLPAELAWATRMYYDSPAFHVYEHPGPSVVTARYLNFVASHIVLAGPQRGDRRVTNALPGQSVHQYGLAIDAVPTLGGKPLWDDSDALDDMGKVGEECGFEWAGRWRSFQEFVHFQMAEWRDVLKGDVR